MHESAFWKWRAIYLAAEKTCDSRGEDGWEGRIRRWHAQLRGVCLGEVGQASEALRHGTWR